MLPFVLLRMIHFQGKISCWDFSIICFARDIGDGVIAALFALLVVTPLFSLSKPTDDNRINAFNRIGSPIITYRKMRK